MCYPPVTPIPLLLMLSGATILHGICVSIVWWCSCGRQVCVSGNSFLCVCSAGVYSRGRAAVKTSLVCRKYLPTLTLQWSLQTWCQLLSALFLWNTCMTVCEGDFFQQLSVWLQAEASESRDASANTGEIHSEIYISLHLSKGGKQLRDKC